MMFHADEATGNSSKDRSSRSLIGPENAAQISLLARLGRGTIRGLTWSSDGRTLAVGSSLGVWLYTPDDLEANPRLIEIPTDGLLNVGISPDGTTLATGHDNGEVWLWDVSTGLSVAMLETGGRVYSVAFSPDGNRLAAGGFDVRLWNIKSGEIVRHFETYDTFSVAFSPDGRRLATGGHDDHDLQVWDVETGLAVFTVPDVTDEGTWSVAFSPDGMQLASAGNYITKVWLWDMQTGQLIRVLQGHNAIVECLAFSPDGTRLASADCTSEVRLWDVQTGQTTAVLQRAGHLWEPSWTSAFGKCGIAFSADGSRLAFGGYDNILRLWDVQTTQPCALVKDHSSPLTCLAFSPDGTRLASSSWDETIRLWDVQTRQCTTLLQGHTASVFSVAFSPDGTQLASGSESYNVFQDGTLLTLGSELCFWDAKTGQLQATWQSPDGVTPNGVVDLAFSPDGSWLVSTGWEGPVQLWNVRSGHPTTILDDHDRFVDSVAFSPDGTLFGGGGHDGTVWLWEVETAQVKVTLPGHRGPVWATAFSPDGLLLASGGEDHTIRLWEVETGQLAATLVGHTNSVLSVTFSPDGALLASGGHDGIIRLWDIKTKHQVAALPSHSGGANRVIFSPDGTLLASGGDDGLVLLWNVQT